jgi:DNA-binding Lrp family transcriptional regulator
VSDDPDLETVAELLDDAYAREILTATSIEPMTANRLSERCDASRSTVYRRTERLVDAGLLGERTRPRADGHHDTVYYATLDRFEVEPAAVGEVEVRLRDGELHVEVDRVRGDLADGLTALWENL